MLDFALKKTTKYLKNKASFQQRLRQTWWSMVRCFNCDKVGHKSADCKLPKKKKNNEANVVDNVAQDVAEISLSTVVSEVNMVGSNPREWWIDTGATRHVCSDEGMFTTFELVHGELSYIGNRGSRKYDPENDLWERADTEERPLCIRNPKEPCVWVTFEQA